MHELSIVSGILDTVEENAEKHGAVSVTEIELEIGLLSGVEYDALTFAIEHAPKTGLLKNVCFQIHKIKPLAQCNDCKYEFETLEYAKACPKCNSKQTTLIKGTELKIKSFSFD